MEARVPVTGAARSLLMVVFLASGTASADPTKRECVDANEAAQALRQHQRLQSARAALATCLATSCPGPVREDCAERLGELDRAMPSVVFEVTDVGGRDLVRVALRVDGALVAPRLDGLAILIDPGPHALTFIPASGRPLETMIEVREGEKDRREHVTVEGTDGDPGKSQRIAGAVVGALGVAGIVVGGALGLVAKSTYDSALGGHCAGDPGHCDGAGLAAVNAAHEQAAGSTASFVVGAILAAGGIALWTTAPRDLRVQPTVGGASLVLGGSF